MPSSALSVLREIAVLDGSLAARASHAVVVAVAMANRLGESDDAMESLAEQVAVGERDGTVAATPIAAFARHVAGHGVPPDDMTEDLRTAYENVRELIQPLAR